MGDVASLLWPHKLWQLVETPTKEYGNGFEVSKESTLSDCVTCVEAKMTVNSYETVLKCHWKLGELTHIDVWGKYEVASINGHQYYIVFTDNATRYTTINFLKRKDEVSIWVKNYMTYLKSHKQTPLAIQVDCGTEFLNNLLKDWCQEYGIDLETTAPYSPSQNGVAEQMNRTLVKLTFAMIRGRRSPEFLWEHAAEHAAYLQNWVYTRNLEGKMLYKAWHGNKPNVRHLCEFGMLVWVLLQGQKELCKILPKLKSHTFVGFDNGPKAVKYYSVKTRKVLTSQNYSFIDPPSNGPPPEEIVVAPNVPCEGESRGSMQPSCTKMPKGNEPKDRILSKGNEPGISCTSSKCKCKWPEGDEKLLDVDTP